MPKAITSTPKITIRTEVGAVAWRRTHHAVDNAVPVKLIVIRRRPDRSSAGPNELRSVAAHRNSAAKMTAAQLVYWITRLVVSSGDRSGIAARIPAACRKHNGFGPKRGQTESVCSLLPVSPVVLWQGRPTDAQRRPMRPKAPPPTPPATRFRLRPLRARRSPSCLPPWPGKMAFPPQPSSLTYETRFRRS